jgi:hypothetical protein
MSYGSNTAHSCSEKNLLKNVDRIIEAIKSGSTTKAREIKKRMEEIDNWKSHRRSGHTDEYVAFIMKEISMIERIGIDL